MTRTNKPARRAIRDGVQDRVRAARVVDRLFVPDKIFGLACPCIRLSPRLYLALRGFITIVGGEDQGEREDGSRDEGKEIRLIEGEDIVPFEICCAERVGDGVLEHGAEVCE